MNRLGARLPVITRSSECFQCVLHIRVRKGLSSGKAGAITGLGYREASWLNVDAVLLQKLDCKHQIDVVRMVRSKAPTQLHGTRPAANLPGVKGRCRPIFGDKNIHRTNSNIASTGATRRARGNCEGERLFIL